ncbi:leukocyte cysteine proteinase inhibitor 1-like [Acanthopagrus latus]|uniref:leukocyte cysteine proteinase inhibitor 1-like n=1 Tax=Acanthopagrus latus TaxID=8177 RepID=UPI00187C3F3D|nr:leukocyte cysteine proteinase inhibitor 1-like [Acanthopagrus latus]
MADIKHGGWSHTMYTDKETQWICDQVRSLVQGKTNKIYQEYRAVLSRNQPVKGTNYLFQVRVGERSYIHVQVYQALPCDGGHLELKGVQEDKTQDHPLEPISN